MAEYELINTTTGAKIAGPKFDVDLADARPRPGSAWAVVSHPTLPNPPPANFAPPGAPVRTFDLLARPPTVTYTTTLRDKTQPELDAEKDQIAVKAAADPQARLAYLLISGLFFAVNDERASRATPLAPLTKAQFLTYCKDNSRPAAQTISTDEFATFIRGLF